MGVEGWGGRVHRKEGVVELSSHKSSSMEELPNLVFVQCQIEGCFFCFLFSSFGKMGLLVPKYMLYQTPS